MIILIIYITHTLCRIIHSIQRGPVLAGGGQRFHARPGSDLRHQSVAVGGHEAAEAAGTVIRSKYCRRWLSLNRCYG